MALPALLLAALPLALPPTRVPPPSPRLQDENREGQGEGQDPRAEKEREQAKMDAERRAKMGKEGAMRAEMEEARKKGLPVPDAGRLVPFASLIVSPSLVLAGSPAYLTVTRFDPAPQPNAPSPTAGQPIQPMQILLVMPNGEEKRLDPASLARVIPAGIEPPGIVPPTAMRKTIDIGKTLEGVPGGTVTIRYETPGGQPAFTQIRVLAPFKGDVEKVDPKKLYLWIETDLEIGRASCRERVYVLV